MQDFDHLVAEQPEHAFTMAGRTWLLPTELPHRAVLYLEALDAGSNMTALQVKDMATHIFGEDTVAEWMAAGVGLLRLTAVCEWALDMLLPGVQTAEGQGDDPNR